jgi:small subunit ribosomal protein S1
MTEPEQQPEDFGAILDAYEKEAGPADPAQAEKETSHQDPSGPEPTRGQAVPAEIAQAHTHGMPIEGTVTEVVKGGVSVMVAGIRGFCPISQLDGRPVADATVFVGRRLTFRVTRFEEPQGKRPNIVLSRRALLEEEAREKAQAARALLEPGKVMRGTVASLTSFGAFIDLGGIEGLLHIGEIAHGRVEHPKDVLAVGQEVEVKVLKIEPAKEGKGKGGERISLSRKALASDPWQAAAALLKPGTRRQAKVVRLQPFGAFMELEPGVDGLLHVSELARDREVRHPKDALKVGQSVEVVVKSVDLGQKRISLGLPGGEADEAEAAAVKLSPATTGQGFGAMADFFKKAGMKQ